MIRLVTFSICLLLSACVTESGINEPPEGAAAEVVQRQLDLGIGYLRNGDYQRAKEKLNRALQVDPKNAAVHAAFGLLFQLEGEDSLAEKYFSSAIRFDPESAQARNSYGAFLFSKKRYQEAVEQLLKAAENRFYPNRPTVFENLGVAYTQVGDKENAEYAFSRAVQLNPEQSRSLLELAVIRYDQSNYVEARALYSRHTKGSPKSPKTLLLCIRLARVFKDANEEASCAEALEGIFPASLEYREYKESL
ncbi:MAG: type IV pilus biogenesis/stability protein PilW [Gammaproteobacteria bacterium]|jgi:type IV pilus assembly protein PilF|nr:type IV pilus biogenesis/stability protein PilW [Gammaproteobacteria bacterium]MBT4492144.1 type IV pilus biogenesis/stability protein PilW [Gammaproteobacteria bacterium]MBT7372300.1 type IV pilus biogenesis/stability protein PilW [Gammaproteobacteria bacterium]